jgi:hypothetical protein
MLFPWSPIGICLLRSSYRLGSRNDPSGLPNFGSRLEAPFVRVGNINDSTGTA